MDIWEAAFCRFGIELTGQEQSSVPPDTQVMISGLGVRPNPVEVVAPIGAKITYAGRAGGLQSEWRTKRVDCTPVRDPVFCRFTIKLHDQNGDVPAGSKVYVTGRGELPNPATIVAPVSCDVEYQPRIGPWRGKAIRKHVDCSDAIHQAFCTFSITLTDQSGGVPTSSKVAVNAVGVLSNPATVSAPLGATVSYAAKLGGFQGPWRYKLVDCSPVRDAAFCTFYIKLTDQYGEVPSGSKVMVRDLGLLPNPTNVTLPVGTTISYAAVLGPWEGGWLRKSVDCTHLTGPNGGPAVAFCRFTLNLTDQVGATPAGTQVAIQGLGTFANPATIVAPLDCDVLYIAKCGSLEGTWRSKHVDCTDVTAQEFCTFSIKLTDQLGHIPANTQILITQFGLRGNPTTLSAPLGSAITYNAKSRNWLGTNRRHRVDCQDVIAAAFCTFTITVIDQGGLAVPGASVYLPSYGNSASPLSLTAPLGAQVAYAARWGDWTGPTRYKYVDCSNVRCPDLRRITFSFVWGTNTSAYTNVVRCAPVASGGSVWIPLNECITYRPVVDGWEGPTHHRQVTTTWSSVTWTLQAAVQ